MTVDSVQDQLKILAAEQGTTMVALVGEGLNTVFAHLRPPGDRSGRTTRRRKDSRSAPPWWTGWRGKLLMAIPTTSRRAVHGGGRRRRRPWSLRRGGGRGRIGHRSGDRKMIHKGH